MMVKNALLLLVVGCVFSPGLCAQGVKGKSLWRLWVKKSVPAEKTAAGMAVSSEAGIRAAREALVQAARRAAYARQLPPYRTGKIPAAMFRSLVQVAGASESGVASGGFVFEEFARGKRTLWAAVPYHVAGGKGNLVTLRLPDGNGSARLYTLEVTVGGGYGRNALDVSLIRLPEALNGQVLALRLSDRPVRPGSLVTAYGYTIRQSRADRPLAVALAAGVTTGFRLSAEGRLPEIRDGFCGAPLVGRSGYVLGMHCASEGGKSFSITAAGIKELLRAHYFGRAEQPVFLWGKRVFNMDSSESIARMTLKRSGDELFRADVQFYSGPFSYDRAEQIFGSRQMQAGDEVLFYITECGKVTRVVRYLVPENP